MKRRTFTQTALALLVALSLPMAAHAATTKAHAATAKSHSKSMAKPAAAPRVDINSATADQLTALPGIDQAAAQKIIDGRPWKNSSQLVAKGVVTKEDFTKLRTKVIARQAKMEHKAENAGTKTPGASGSPEGTTK